MDESLPSENKDGMADGAVTAVSEQSLTVFFPCFNEEGTVEKLTRDTVEVIKGICDDYEVIIVNDGSSDGTAEIADRLAQEIDGVKVIHHKVNSGYGAALQTGFRAASKKLVFYTDGDGQFDIEELPKLMPLISECDIVSGYRINRQDSFMRKFNAFGWGKLVCILFNMKVRDIDCAFKLYKREIFDNIKMKSNGALIDTEILARAIRKGYKIKQIGVSHYPRLVGESTGANIKVIIRAFKELFKLRKEIMKG